MLLRSPVSLNLLRTSIALVLFLASLALCCAEPGRGQADKYPHGWALPANKWARAMLLSSLCASFRTPQRSLSRRRCHTTCKSSATSSLWRCVSVLAKTDFN
jgi:hypothetical protein